MRVFLLATIFCLVSAAGYCATLNVPTDFPTINAAVLESMAGDEIVVRPGVYQEHDIVIESPIVLRSSTPGQEVVINAQGLGNGLNVATNGSVGFYDITIIGGVVGIYVEGYRANSIVIERCRVSETSTYGIHCDYCWETSIRLQDCVVSQNNGTGLFLLGLLNCEISNSEISGNGDTGLYIIAGYNFECQNTLISGNFGNYGGGAALIGCNANMTNVVFSDNVSSSVGGGMAIGGAGTYFMESCSFSSCAAPVGAQVYLEEEAGYSVNATFNCCDIDAGLFGGAVWEQGLVQITEVGCSVSNERQSWDSVKSMYR